MTAFAQESEPSPRGRALILRVGGDLRGERSEQARQAVAAALVGEGWTEMSRASLLMRVSPARLDGCADLACAQALGAELGADAVVAVALWAGPDGYPGSVAVSLADAEGARAGSAEVGEEGLVAAARGALTEALGGPLSPIPESQEAHAGIEENSNSSAQEDESSSGSQQVEENSESGEAASPPAGGVGEPTNEWDRLVRMVFPVLLGLLGVTAVGLGAYALTDENCELRGASGVCLRGDAPNPSTGIALLIGGSLAAAGSIVWLIYGGQPGLESEPIELSLRPTVGPTAGSRAGLRAGLELGVRW